MSAEMKSSILASHLVKPTYDVFNYVCMDASHVYFQAYKYHIDDSDKSLSTYEELKDFLLVVDKYDDSLTSCYYDFLQRLHKEFTSKGGLYITNIGDAKGVPKCVEETGYVDVLSFYCGCTGGIYDNAWSDRDYYPKDQKDLLEVQVQGRAFCNLHALTSNVTPAPFPTVE